MKEEYGFTEFNETEIPCLPHYIETHKSFCISVNALQNMDIDTVGNVLKLRRALEQSKTLFTELNGERLRLELEYSRLDISFKFPSKTLLNNVEYESFHNSQVICMSQFMMSSCITDNNLFQIKMYLYMIKTQIQEMANHNHHITINIHRKCENPHCLNI